MYHPGKFRPKGTQRDSRGINPVHLTLHATATPVSERPSRRTPDKFTNDPFVGFKPSELPLNSRPGTRKLSVSSEFGHSDTSPNLTAGPNRANSIVGPPLLLHTLSDTRLLSSKGARHFVSPAKASATEFTPRLTSGDISRRQSSTGTKDTTIPVSDIESMSSHNRSQYHYNSGTSSNSTNYRHAAQPTTVNYRDHHHEPEKSTPYLPGDRVIFAESPSAPGIPIVYRTVEERSSNPDRLNLDRRKLTVCPILEGEEHLRLLNFQHNQISKIQHLSNLRRLIFLDLYDNSITDMTGLSSLKSLRVLMLGKNRIRHITSLETLSKLDVLDLHGNQIEVISNLRHLTELRVLNLAGNQIEQVDNLAGMDTLTELNLRRNKITSIREIDLLPSLQRLFLSYNSISRWENVICLGESPSLCEISLDGNPIASESCYKQMILKNMIQLKQLDSKRITDDERRVAAVIVRKEEERKREVHKQAIAKEKKRLAINNAARQWEAEFGVVSVNTVDEMTSSSSLNSYRSDYSNRTDGTGSMPGNAAWLNYAESQRSFQQNPHYITENSKQGTGSHLPQATSLDMSESYLAEIDGDCLQLFGPGALDSLDKNWGAQASSSVTTISVQFINFNDFCSFIPKIRNRFPNAKNLIFKEVNLHSLPQINALSQMRRLESISVECSPGNPITQYSLWRLYILFRLSHFELKKVNNDPVTPAEVENAENIFGMLSDVTSFELSQYRLLSIVGDGTAQASAIRPQNKPKTKQIVAEADLQSADKTGPTESIGKIGLQYYPTKVIHASRKKGLVRKQIAHQFVQDVCDDVVLTNKKHAALDKVWPSIFVRMVKESLSDMWNMEDYLKQQYASVVDVNL